MKTGSLKYVLKELLVYITFWLVGVVTFWSLILLLQEKFDYRVDWITALIWSIIPSYFWFIIGALLSWKDDKIAEGSKAISDAVAKLFQTK